MTNSPFYDVIKHHKTVKKNNKITNIIPNTQRNRLRHWGREYHTNTYHIQFLLFENTQ